MQVVENWSDVVARVITVEPQTGGDGLRRCQVEILEVLSVEGWPNLFEAATGDLISLTIPETAITAELAPGSVIRCRIRLGGPLEAFAHPEHLTVLPPT
jgi:hypothetical protein